MFTRKIGALSLIAVLLAASCVCLYAAQQEGYFGTDEENDFSDVYQKISREEVKPDPMEDDSGTIQTESDEDIADYDPSVIDIGYDDIVKTKDTPKEEPLIVKQKPAQNFENFSEDTKKVLQSYGLGSAFTSVLNMHNDAAKAIGNKEKAERYEIIFRDYPNDYLAAYRVAQANMAMGRKGRAEEWLGKALAINPNYSPAKQLMKKAKNR